MATRLGAWSGSPRKAGDDEGVAVASKRRRTTGGWLEAEVPAGGDSGVFEELPDELVVSIIADVSATANSPVDLVFVLLTCKRFRRLGQHDLVYQRASSQCVAVRARCWSINARLFLVRCSLVGNIDACYLLGMIMFYCVRLRTIGMKLMSWAALRGQADALYSLGIIQFNGSGGLRADRNVRLGALYCSHAAKFGHIDALRELGHCFSDGFGVSKNVSIGRDLVVKANLSEIRAASEVRRALLKSHRAAAPLNLKGLDGTDVPPACLFSDFGCNATVAVETVHSANAFLTEWFASRPVGMASGFKLRLCSNPTCGRPETRHNEFRRCSVCGAVIYCSRGCQARHWRGGHWKNCTPINRRLLRLRAARINLMGANVNVDGPVAPM